MAKNDTILIDGILDDRSAERLPSDRRDEVFEYFAIEQILRDADLSSDEIKSGWIDGRDDGGIDGFFVLINGHLLNDPLSFTWPRSGCELDIWIITCKHHDTFRQAPLDSLVASVTEILDFSIHNDSLRGAYSDGLIKARSLLAYAYRKVSSKLTRFTLRFVYASRGDTTSIGESIKARAEQAITIAKEMFGNCQASFEFVGAAELVGIHRKVRAFSLELPFLEALTRGERYVLLCRLADFYSFVIDENKKLRRYIFDSNVRAFMGLNGVNEDIRNTLMMEDSPDFWWLNNGVTILATNAVVVGKSIQLEGVQIVNGLQTTESIARYFGEGNEDQKDRAVLVKIIVSTDSSVRDAIIRATNNQTAVELSSLHATDKIQRDIEETLLRSGLFYERRTNYYKEQGKPTEQIISPLYVAAGYVNLVLKSPFRASHLKSKFMRSKGAYEAVFSEKAPLKVWPIIAMVLKKTDAFLETVRPVGTVANERFLKGWRQIVALLTVSRLFGRFSFSEAELAALDTNRMTPDIIASTWDIIQRVAGGNLSAKHIQGRSLFRKLCHEATKIYSLDGVSSVAGANFDRSILADHVNAMLPPQPWKPGVHRDIAQQLGCSHKEVLSAIDELIASGRRHVQIDGIVYAQDGSIIMIDQKPGPSPINEQYFGDESEEAKENSALNNGKPSGGGIGTV